MCFLSDDCSALKYDWTFERSCDFDHMTAHLWITNSFTGIHVFMGEIQTLDLKCPTLGQFTLHTHTVYL